MVEGMDVGMRVEKHLGVDSKVNGEKRSMDRIRDVRMSKEEKDQIKFSDLKIEENSAKKLQQIKVVQKNKGMLYKKSYGELVDFTENLYLTQADAFKIKKIHTDLRNGIVDVNNKFKVVQDDSDLMIDKLRNFKTCTIETLDPMDVNMENLVTKEENGVNMKNSLLEEYGVLEDNCLNLEYTIETTGVNVEKTLNEDNLVMFDVDLLNSVSEENTVRKQNENINVETMISSDIAPIEDKDEPKTVKYVKTLSLDAIVDDDLDFL